MSRGFDQAVIDRVRDAANIVEVIGRYVTLTQKGPRYVGLCPFHAEKTPSFSVNPDMRIYKCFGCGEGGNVFSFLMKHAGLTFPEAVRELAEQYHIPLPTEERTPEQRRQMRTRDKLLRVCQIATEFFVDNLAADQGRAARAYLADRGMGREIIDRFSLGWSPDAWDGLARYLEQRKVPLRLAEAAGLVSPRKSGDGYYDRFRARIIFPIRDAQGKTVAFGGRGIVPENEPKYLNSPETDLFKKGQLLYGRHEAQGDIRRKKRVIVVEGYFDCLALVAAGFTETTATLGTALTGKQVSLLRGLGSEVFLVYDADLAGVRAAIRAQEIFAREEVRARVVGLPDGLDPDDFIKVHGPEAMEEELNRAKDMTSFVLDRLLDRPLSNPGDKAAALQEVAPVLNKIASPVEQAAHIQETAHRMGVPEEAVYSGLTRGGRMDATPDRTVGRDALARDWRLVADLISDPEFTRAMLEAGVEYVINDELCRQILAEAARIVDAGGDCFPADLIDRLPPEAADLAADLAWDQPPRNRDQYLNEVLNTIRTIKKQSAADVVCRQIEQAQRAGDEEKVFQLLSRLKTLRRDGK